LFFSVSPQHHFGDFKQTLVRINVEEIFQISLKNKNSGNINILANIDKPIILARGY